MSDPAGSVPAVDLAAYQRAAYVHIPFCHRRCPYCDFAVIDLEAESASFDRYVAALEAEIEMEPGWLPLDAINLGGGTPSLLSAEQLGRVLGGLEQKFGFAANVEISIEANPEDWTAVYAAALRSLGINRVSLGVQSFDSAVLAALGRLHDPATAIAAVETTQRTGYDVVNLDLIFGTPGESMAAWQDSVATALDLGVNHLSAYALTVELGTALSRSIRDGAAGPDEDDLADKYEHLHAAVGNRLDHYEVSNWAEPGRECRYNLTTWAQGEYLGFGLGAHGHRDGIRSRNVRRLDAYLQRVERGTSPEAGREELGDWEREKERVYLGLRRRAGVVLGVAGAALIASPHGRRLVAAGVVEVAGDRLVVAQPLLADAVAREVLALER
jgi:oxygen-independent coproporphyrinogen-3 oxidase